MSLFWLYKVDTSWAPVGGNRDAYFLHAVEKDMLLILDIISITTICRGVTLIPCRCLIKTWDVNTKSETSCSANDITRKVKKHVCGKDVRRMCDQSPLCRKSTFISTRHPSSAKYFSSSLSTSSSSRCSLLSNRRSQHHSQHCLTPALTQPAYVPLKS